MSASNDTIGDFLTSIRNASKAERATVVIQWSRLREGVARILTESGYIAQFRKVVRDEKPALELTLKYVSGVPPSPASNAYPLLVVAFTLDTLLCLRLSAAWEFLFSPPHAAS